MNERLHIYLSELESHFQEIPESRKPILKMLVDYVKLKSEKKEVSSLVFICTHNSRRSYFGQVWAKTAAAFYGITDIITYSGGTAVTACHPYTIEALERAGFEVEKHVSSINPVIQVVYDKQTDPIVCFSKTYDHGDNPRKDFAAILTCSEADQNCPFIPGADMRIPLTYEDPKRWDDSDQKDAKYDERCRQIALEMLHVFNEVKKERRF